jgi:hypothetical protein
MELIAIPMAHYTAFFRPLMWREHQDILAKRPQNYVTEVLGTAFVRVNTTDIPNLSDAKKVLGSVPFTYLQRAWVLYNAGLPHQATFTTPRLYEAPSIESVRERRAIEETEEETAGDHALRQLESQYGSPDVLQAMSVEAQILANAKRTGLQPAKVDK